MPNVIFDGANHNSLVTIEGKASAAISPGHVAAVATSGGATTFAPAAYTSGQVVPELWVADKNFLQAGKVSTAYANGDEMIVRLLPAGETAFLRCVAGTYNKGTRLYPSATGGTLTPTAPATTSIRPVATVIENAGVLGATGLVRVVAN